MSKLREGVAIVKAAFQEFGEDEAMTRAAALAYYSALSMAPMLLLLIWIAGLLGKSTQDKLVEQITGVVGPQAGEAVQMVLQNAQQNPSAGTIAGIIGIATLAFSATGVLAQLQVSMNRIWDVKAAPGQGLFGWLRKRVLSLGMLLAIAFLLLVSMAISTVLAAADQFTAKLPGGPQLWQLVNLAVSLAVFAAVFAMLFKYMPDVRIAWRDVIFGGIITAVLFTIGKTLVGIYLGQGSVGSAYGAAGSLIVLLVWVYYASVIFFLGAEFTQVRARRRGRGIEPDSHAVRIDRESARTPRTA